ncbi:MAG: 3-methyl-2-oxobutanoate hydroxymethyltransferase [Phycisphaeraceae bacterium]|nr:3-methyl-2-oxobutanoate hydroxymethyltransferase [Phycisphaeraceae bacterium]
MGSAANTAPRVSLPVLARMAAAGTPFACLTCYDATTARWLARGGVHVLLVGDTAAEMVLGLPRTIDMPLDVLLALTAGVKRGAPDVVVMGDMPFMSYHASEAEAIRNAGRFLTEGLADIVKIEADASFAPLVEKLTRAGIPICGHVGSKPQHVALTGGYSSAGRTAAEARRIVDDAVALERAGAKMLLVEAVPPEVTRAILDATTVPLIGIGAGTDCHGQVLVLQDLVGMTDRPPRFAEPVANLGRSFESASRDWVERVAARRIGGQAYSMKQGEVQKLAAEGFPGVARPQKPEEPPQRADLSPSAPAAASRQAG